MSAFIAMLEAQREGREPTPEEEAAYIEWCDRMQAMRDANPPEVDDVMVARGYFNWSWKGSGFGQLSFDLKDGKITCGNECMDRERVRKILHAFADYLADNAELEC